MIKIGEFAKICNVSTQTLRYYDAEGLLKPDITDPSSGYRYYSLEAVDKIKEILYYKNLDFSLDEIKAVQSATAEELKTLLQQKKKTLSDSIEKNRQQLAAIEKLLEGDTTKPGLSDILLLPFENDSQAVGKWKLCGFLSDENDRTSLQEICDDAVDSEIIFMPGGAMAWKYFWTKGTLYRISPNYTFAIPNTYRIAEQDGSRCMTVNFLSDECLDNGTDALVLLYRQVDCTEYTEYQIRKKIDKTDLPYVEDKSVCGEWIVSDYVPAIADFHPNVPYSSKEDIFISDIRFLPRGICTRTVRSRMGKRQYMLRYSKGFVLNDKELTAEEYQINSIHGKEYLFVQHKSGDYYYAGLAPHWYVFKRKQ